MRETLHGKHSSICDELEERIGAAEYSKKAALESELCAVDVALERLQADRGVVAESVASLSDADLLAHHGELSARLDAAEAQLLALPTTVVEPPLVEQVVDWPALLAGAAAFGRVVAPRAITAADLAVEWAACNAYPGGTLRLSLALQGPHSQSAEELDAALGAAAAATLVEASLEAPSAVPQPLRVDVSADALGRCVAISIGIPASTPTGLSVCFGALTVSGRPVAGLPDALLVKVRGE